VSRPNPLDDRTVISSIAIDPRNPSRLLAAENSGLYESLDGGESWVRNGLPITSEDPAKVVLAPSNPDIVYVALDRSSDSRVAVQRSNDGGQTWTQGGLGLPPSTRFVDDLEVDPVDPEVVYMVSRGKLYRSVDGAASWNQLAEDVLQDVGSLAIRPDDPQILFAGSDSGREDVKGVFRSRDGGSTWLAVNRGLVDLEVFDLVIDQQNPATVYAATANGVSVSADEGETWSPAGRGPEGSFSLKLAVHPSEPGIVYAGNSLGQVYRLSQQTSWLFGAGEFQQNPARFDGLAFANFSLRGRESQFARAGSGGDGSYPRCAARRTNATRSGVREANRRLATRSLGG